MYSQNTPGIPRQNQLANSAVCQKLARLSLSERRQKDKQTDHQAKKTIEHWNRLSDNPREYPQGQPDRHPGADGDEIALLHAVGAGEDTHVDGFACDVSCENARDDDLILIVRF